MGHLTFPLRPEEKTPAVFHRMQVILTRFDAHVVAFLLGVFGWLIPGSVVEVWEATVCPKWRLIDDDAIGQDDRLRRP